ncbi:PREDICTED: reticulon-1-like isoform X2 [Ceratosolen solmsi marchali]|uniref:Reticulon-like protein n=1 Tax=Ceratosolen solmsi marchali TaxID=326594 RepID=A0AAJ6YIF1_9HYME|nr:PREDICTED: reticulon-1-like isoform X2 [Ceratosolen solmsi marchali]
MSEFVEHQHQRQQQPLQPPPPPPPLSQQQQQQPLKPLKRELDSTDDFEHLEHELQQTHQQPLLDLSNNLVDFDRMSGGPQSHNQLDGPAEEGPERRNLLDTSVPASNGIECDLKPVPATPPPSADLEKFDLGGSSLRNESRDELGTRLREQLEDFKDARMNVLDNDYEEGQWKPESPIKYQHDNILLNHDKYTDDDDNVNDHGDNVDVDDEDTFAREEFGSVKKHEPPITLYGFGDIKSSSLPEPENSPELDFVKDEIIVHEATCELPRHREPELWNVLEKSGNDRFEEREVLHEEPPNKPLPPIPASTEPELFHDEDSLTDLSEADIIDEEKLEPKPDPSPTKSLGRPMTATPQLSNAPERKFYREEPTKSREIEEIAPKDIFRRIGIVASLIYWRDPKKSGIVFGVTLGVLLSLAYFSLISVLAYISLFILLFTIAFRIYKTVIQAVQKTSDGHPFKDILELDLTLPSSKVHEVADIAVANANAAVTELRRLFLVEDFVDSLKFGFLLWFFTYLGSWFNGMTLIIILVVALFTLPKIYETNKTQIDQNLALVQAKLSEITVKIKAALPLGKKIEPSKVE